MSCQVNHWKWEAGAGLAAARARPEAREL